MIIPYRGNTGNGTYFITASAYQKMCLLQSDRMADLFVEVLYWYRDQHKFLVHEFVVMPNHFHLLITPGQGSAWSARFSSSRADFLFVLGKNSPSAARCGRRASTTGESAIGQSSSSFRDISTRIPSGVD
jgi:putative transposase